MEQTEVSDVRLRWDPADRLVLMDFRPGANPGEAEARACIAQMRAWAGDAPYRLLVDCENLATTGAGWRVAFGDYFNSNPRQVRLAWFNMNLVVRVMVQMFLRATGLAGRGFATEAQARAWLMEDSA